MLTGQETISELLQKFPMIRAPLAKFGLSPESEEYFHYRNLAHAALLLKIPLQKILEEVSSVTGEPIASPKVKGLPEANRAIGAPGTDRLKPGFHRTGRPPDIKRVIAVHSGKGGVGKTFVSINLAAHFAKKGLKVGLLDADVDCPNIMKALQLEGKLYADQEKKMVPLQKFGIKVMSMAPLLENESQVLLWRGPIVSRVVEQFIYDTAWGELDVLILDLPPGTGDIPLTLFQLLKESELIIVTTSQKLALMDARKSAVMAQKTGIHLLGLIENMTGDIFGKTQGKKLAKDLGIPFLAEIPLKKTFARFPSDGKPPVLSSKTLREIFEKIGSRL